MRHGCIAFWDKAMRSTLTLAFSPKERETACLALFSFGRRAGDEGHCSSHSATPLKDKGCKS